MKTRLLPRLVAASASLASSSLARGAQCLATALAVASGGAGCTWGPPSGYMPPIQVVANAAQPTPVQDMFTPLVACANQRGLSVQRFGELVQVHLDRETMLEYHYDNNRNLVMSARFMQPIPPLAQAERSELAHARGNEIYACAGYGSPVYLGASEPASPPPQVFAAQPAPLPQPAFEQQTFANSAMCGRLDACVDEATREACPPNDMRCLEGFRMRAAQDPQCREGLERVSRRLEEMRRERPNLRLPQACLPPDAPSGPTQNAQAQGRPQPMGPACSQLQNCYRDLTDEACRAHNAHCQQGYQMRDHSEAACEMALHEMNIHQEEMRRNNPGFVLPGSCRAR